MKDGAQLDDENHADTFDANVKIEWLGDVTVLHLPDRVGYLLFRLRDDAKSHAEALAREVYPASVFTWRDGYLYAGGSPVGYRLEPRVLF